ncbi:peptidase S9, prolyl oligopeptidase active site region [Luminiphilus syltensis NOR5-1B]|uniref:Peptidase S9, prolyl oligopeptidase active site region n=1 Tax=Luminiphilus syltensis NOR5-1B TaxID=565045 RepID=B8KVS6_9GAMM|nr:peptidase S9, prolyl oligopeptidase active site region [Luminiphilus syltensis NOR5-1B]
MPGLAQAATQQRSLTIDDLLALKSVAAPAISPDAGWVAYTVEAVDGEADESSTQIFMVSRAGDDVVQLTADDYSASSPRWSPDGRYLGFLAARGAEDDEPKTQVWTLDRRGGEAQAYTAVDQGVSDFRWAPDGKGMLLVIRDKTAADLERETAHEEGRDERPLPHVIDRLEFKQDGVPYLDRSRTHIYAVRGRGETPLQLTFGDFDDSQPAWRPDGREIAFVSNRADEPDATQNTDIWIVSAVGDASSRKARRVTSNIGSDYAPAWSRDGKQIAYVTVTEPDLIWYATNHLAIVPAAGGTARVLTAALDRNVIKPAFTPDGRGITFVLEDSAEQHLARYDLETGSIDRQVRGELIVEDYSQNLAGDTALTISVPHSPAEVFLLADDALEPLTRTNANVLSGLGLAEVNNVTFPSADGTEVEGFIFTPPDFRKGRRYPTILRIHGGPVSQYDFGFNAEAQLFAAEGYVVVISNPRGSSGYGQDYSAALFANWGVPDFEDVMAAVDYAIDQGYSDPDRLGVGGWSYGGILTNYVITKSDRFAGAITGASEVNYIANYGHDQYQYIWEAELGLPWENKEAWERISPWEGVDKVVTPTLVIGGKDDWNVPIQNSEQLYQALKRRGIDTQLVVYPDEDHSIDRPSFRRDRWQRYLDWYDRTVRGQ